MKLGQRQVVNGLWRIKNKQLLKTVPVSNSTGQKNVRALTNKFGEVLVRRKQQNQLEI